MSSEDIHKNEMQFENDISEGSSGSCNERGGVENGDYNEKTRGSASHKHRFKKEREPGSIDSDSEDENMVRYEESYTRSKKAKRKHRPAQGSGFRPQHKRWRRSRAFDRLRTGLRSFSRNRSRMDNESLSYDRLERAGHWEKNWAPSIMFKTVCANLNHIEDYDVGHLQELYEDVKSMDSFIYSARESDDFEDVFARITPSDILPLLIATNGTLRSILRGKVARA